MIQINSRHNFLDGFLGTKPEEDISYAKANEVNLWITVTICICCFLEIILYFAYNRMVNKQNNVDPDVAGIFGVLCWCPLPPNFRRELRLNGQTFFQFHFQVHPWLPIVKGVKQEDEKIEMVEKGNEN